MKCYTSRWLFNTRVRRRLNGKSGTGPLPLPFPFPRAHRLYTVTLVRIRYSLSPPLPFPLHTPIFQLIRVHSWYRAEQPYPSASRFYFLASPIFIFLAYLSAPPLLFPPTSFRSLIFVSLPHAPCQVQRTAVPFEILTNRTVFFVARGCMHEARNREYRNAQYRKYRPVRRFPAPTSILRHREHKAEPLLLSSPLPRPKCVCTQPRTRTDLLKEIPRAWVCSPFL